MIKKRDIYIIILLSIPFVQAITPESLLQTYTEFYGWFDFLLYTLIFTGITKLAIEGIFKKTGEDSKAITLLYTGLGLLFSISLVTWEIKSGFYLYQLGPFIIILLALLFLAWLWKLIKSRKKGEKYEALHSLRYIAIFLLLLIIAAYVLFPNILYYYFWSTWINEALAIAIIICILIILFSIIPKKKEEKEEFLLGRKAAKDERKRLEAEEATRRESERIAEAAETARRKKLEEKEKGLQDERRKKQREKEELERKALVEAEREKREKIKENEKEKKRKENEIKKARIGIIKQIEPYAKSRDGTVLTNKSKAEIEDHLTFIPKINNSIDNISFIWKIGKDKYEKKIVPVPARRIGIGMSKISLIIRDELTDYEIKKTLKLNITKKEEEKIEILKEPLKIRIMGSIGVFDENNQFIRKRSIDRKRRNLINEQENEGLELQIVPEINREFYKILWIVSTEHRWLNRKTLRRKNEEILMLNPKNLSGHGERKIKLIVSEKDNPKIRSKDEIHIIIRGKSQIEKIRETGRITTVKGVEEIKDLLKGRTKRKIRKIKSIIETLKEPIEKQEMYIKEIHPHINKIPSTGTVFGTFKYEINYLNSIIAEERKIKDKLRDIEKIQVNIGKSKNREIQRLVLRLSSLNNRMNFEDYDLDMKKVINDIIKSLKRKDIVRAKRETDGIHSAILLRKKLLSDIKKELSINI